jgi:hypothetical protein
MHKMNMWPSPNGTRGNGTALSDGPVPVLLPVPFKFLFASKVLNENLLRSL